jgi:hypothetical protein
MSRSRLARTNANDQLTDYVPLDAESDQLAGEAPTGIDSPSTPAAQVRTHTSRLLDFSTPRVEHMPERVAEWRSRLHRVRPSDEGFRFENESEADASRRKKHTVLLKNLECGDVMALRGDFSDVFTRLSGGQELIGGEIVIEGGSTTLQGDDLAQSAWGWARYNIVKNGVAEQPSRPTVFYKTAVTHGYTTTQDFIKVVVAPYLSKFGIAVAFLNAPRPPPTFEIKLSTGSDGEFRLTGDTYQANGTATAGEGILRFKEYGLIFKSPFWFSKKWVHNADPIYDETVLLAALNASAQIKLSTTDGSYTKGTDGMWTKT